MDIMCGKQEAIIMKDYIIMLINNYRPAGYSSTWKQNSFASRSLLSLHGIQKLSTFHKLHTTYINTHSLL